MGRKFGEQRGDDGQDDLPPQHQVPACLRWDMNVTDLHQLRMDHKIQVARHIAAAREGGGEDAVQRMCERDCPALSGKKMIGYFGELYQKSFGTRGDQPSESNTDSPESGLTKTQCANLYTELMQANINDLRRRVRDESKGKIKPPANLESISDKRKLGGLIVKALGYTLEEFDRWGKDANVFDAKRKTAHERASIYDSQPAKWRMGGSE